MRSVYKNRCGCHTNHQTPGTCGMRFMPDEVSFCILGGFDGSGFFYSAKMFSAGSIFFFCSLM